MDAAIRELKRETAQIVPYPKGVKPTPRLLGWFYYELEEKSCTVQDGTVHIEYYQPLLNTIYIFDYPASMGRP